MEYEKLMQDEMFVKRVSGAADYGEVCEILREYGVEATEEDLRSAAEGVQGELDETTLDNVAGGLSLSTTVKMLFGILGSMPKANPILPIWPR